MKKQLENTVDTELYNRIANKLANIEDKFLELESVAKIINIWAKENDYELIPFVKILNNKMNDIAKIING